MSYSPHAISVIRTIRGNNIRRMARRLACLAVWLALCSWGWARTIVIDANEADRMAAIADSAPRHSWAASEASSGIYTASIIDLLPGRAFLIRFPLGAIPAGQRITNAELILPVEAFRPMEARLYVWRLLADWGAGVSYLFRTTRPGKLAWTTPGARGVASDRAVRPTAIARLTAAGEQIFNVTEDIELWNTGAATNNGWIVTVEDQGATARLTSPLWQGASAWKLKITYEPE